MLKITIRTAQFLSATSAALILSSTAIASSSAPERVSSLCQAQDLQDVKCENSRECASKTRSAIETFFDKYEVPSPQETAEFEYPNSCSRGSTADHTVNLTYSVLPDGRPHGVQVLNSSNDCFSRAAMDHFEKIKFEATEHGYECVPATVSFVANSSNKPEKISEDYRGPMEEPFNYQKAYDEIRAANLKRGQ